MANVATLTETPTFGAGVSADAVIANAITVDTGTTATSVTFGLPAVGNGALFNPNLPIAVAISSAGGVSGDSNSGLPAAVGVQAVTLSGSTVTVTFVTNAASNQTIPASTRFLFTQQIGS